MKNADAWRRIARRDWRRVALMLSTGDADDAGFHLQQALEKFLKAFLSTRGQPLKKTHELPALLALAEHYASTLERFRELCERVSGYYVLTRYPVPGPDIDPDQVRRDLEQSRAFLCALFPDEPVD